MNRLVISVAMGVALSLTNANAQSTYLPPPIKSEEDRQRDDADKAFKQHQAEIEQEKNRDHFHDNGIKIDEHTSVSVDQNGVTLKKDFP